LAPQQVVLDEPLLGATRQSWLRHLCNDIASKRRQVDRETDELISVELPRSWSGKCSELRDVFPLNYTIDPLESGQARSR
jgi:hypothetical protein